MSSQIIYLCHSFPVVSETFISDQVKALLDNNVNVQVLALHAGENQALNDEWTPVDAQRKVVITVCRTKRDLCKTMLALPRLALRILLKPACWQLTIFCALRAPRELKDALICAAWLRKNPQDGDLLVCHFGTIGYVGALLRAWGWLDAPQITVFHGFDMSSILRKKGERFYQRLFQSPGHSSVAITKYWQKLLCKIGDPAASWIPLGVDTESINYRPRCFPSNRPVRLVTVGRLTDKKGQADVLRALASLPSENEWATNWEYHLVGGGPEEQSLRALCSEFGLEDKVVFHGPLLHSQALAVLNSADIFVLTSRTARNGDMEGLPVALMEALASGMPTLSTYHSGIPELIVHGESGLLAVEGETTSIRNNLAKILTQPELWEKLSAGGRKKVKEEYDAISNFGRFLAHVRSVIRTADYMGSMRRR